MNKIYLFSLLLFTHFISSSDSFGKGCNGTYNVGGTVYYTNHIYPVVTVDTLFNMGEAINLPVNISLTTLGQCTCSIKTLSWMHNGVQISSDTNHTIQEPGTYHIYIDFNYGTWCVNDGGQEFILNVGYSTVTIVNTISDPSFKIYPSVSSGIINIRSSTDYHPFKISITDSEGRIMYTTLTHLSEIDLSNLANGIYFYIVEDKLQKIYRGKIIKN